MTLEAQAVLCAFAETCLCSAPEHEGLHWKHQKTRAHFVVWERECVDASPGFCFS